MREERQCGLQAPHIEEWQRQHRPLRGWEKRLLAAQQTPGQTAVRPLRVCRTWLVCVLSLVALGLVLWTGYGLVRLWLS